MNARRCPLTVTHLTSAECLEESIVLCNNKVSNLIHYAVQKCIWFHKGFFQLYHKLCCSPPNFLQMRDRGLNHGEPDALNVNQSGYKI